MTEFTIDTDEDNEDLGQVVRETETSELLDIYRHLESKTLFQYVADELDFRAEHERDLDHPQQAEEIEKALGR